MSIHSGRTNHLSLFFACLGRTSLCTAVKEPEARSMNGVQENVKCVYGT